MCYNHNLTDTSNKHPTVIPYSQFGRTNCSTYGRRGSQQELDLNSQGQHW